MAQGQKIDRLETRVDNLEERMDLVEGKVYDLDHSVGIIDKNIKKIEKDIAKNKDNETLLTNLMIAQKKAEARRGYITEHINSNSDLDDYYNSLLSDITAIYIATQAISTGKMAKSEADDSYSMAAGYLEGFVELIPVFGGIANKLLQGAAYIADLKQNIITQRDLNRVRDLSQTMSEFDEIAIRLAVSLTKQNEDKIKSCKEEKLPKDLKSYFNFDTLSGGAKSIMTKYLSDEKSKASILGKADAQQVIQYLQQDKVTKKLKFKKNQNKGTQEYKRKESVIAEDIIENLAKIKDEEE